MMFDLTIPGRKVLLAMSEALEALHDGHAALLSPDGGGRTARLGGCAYGLRRAGARLQGALEPAKSATSIAPPDGAAPENAPEQEAELFTPASTPVVACVDVPTDFFQAHREDSGRIWLSMNTAHAATRITIIPAREQLVNFHRQLGAMLDLEA